MKPRTTQHTPHHTSNTSYTPHTTHHTMAHYGTPYYATLPVPTQHLYLHAYTPTHLHTYTCTPHRIASHDPAFQHELRRRGFGVLALTGLRIRMPHACSQEILEYHLRFSPTCHWAQAPEGQRGPQCADCAGDTALARCDAVPISLWAQTQKASRDLLIRVAAACLACMPPCNLPCYGTPSGAAGGCVRAGLRPGPGREGPPLREEASLWERRRGGRSQQVRRVFFAADPPDLGRQFPERLSRQRQERPQLCCVYSCCCLVQTTQEAHSMSDRPIRCRDADRKRCSRGIDGISRKLCFTFMTEAKCVPWLS